MKTVAIIFLSLLSLFNSACNIYKCIDDTQAKSKQICQITEKTDIKTISVRACPSGSKCEGKVSSGVLYCVNQFVLAKEGESCLLDSECQSGKCKEKKCFVQIDNGTCEDDIECSNNSYCKKGICTALLKKGDSCEINNDCGYGLLCNKKVCTQMYSLPNGAETDEDELCQSLLTSGGKCYDTDYVEGAEKKPVKCTKDSDCKIQKIVGETKETIDGYCLCSYSGESYCQLPTLSEEFQNFVKVAKKEIEGFKVGSINVAQARKQKQLGNYNINAALIKAINEGVNVDTCVIDAFYSNGNTIKTSLSMIALLIFILF